MRRFCEELNRALHRLARAPLFTLVVVFTLALGIGGTTLVFSVEEGILLKPLPYPHAEELVGVWQTAPGWNISELQASVSLYFTYREENRTFQEIGLLLPGTASVTGGGEPEQVASLLVTEGTLPVLKVAPLLGRWFSSADVLPHSSETVILSYGYWKTKFGGDPSILGRTIVIDGKGHDVIGVLPRGFQALDSKPSLLLPLQFNRNEVVLGDFAYRAVARLKPGVTLLEANADEARMLPLASTKFPPPKGYTNAIFEEGRIGPNIRPLIQDVIGDIGKLLWVVLIAAGAVLFIACANVTNLFLVRVNAQQQEFATRVALGASRFQIASQLFLESIFLGLGGGLVGLVFVFMGLRLLFIAAPGNLPRLEEISIDRAVLIFAFAISIVSSTFVGAIPVLKYTRPNVASMLRMGGRGLSASRERRAAQSALVIVQVAVALVLLVCSGLMIRTYYALTHVQPGFKQPEQVQTFRITIPEAQVREPGMVAEMQRTILQAVEAVPGIQSAGLTSSVPFDGQDLVYLVFAQGQSFSESQSLPIRHYKFISPDFLGTLGIPIVAGRDFTWDDINAKRPVALISENYAREVWHEPRLALGKQVQDSLRGPWREVVGVAGDVRDDGVDQGPPTTAYWPILMEKFWGEPTFARRTLAFVARSRRAGTQALLQDIQRSVWSVNSNLPLAEVTTLDELLKKSTARTSFALLMLGIAGAIALFLSITGIYAVTSYSVSQRTREIAIRMAMGAQERNLVGLFVQRDLALGVIGIAIGLVTAVGATKYMSSVLFNVGPIDAITYAMVSLVLIGATVAASYFPARRAVRINPAEIARME